MRFWAMVLSEDVYLFEDGLVEIKMSNLETHEQIVAEEDEGSNPRRGISLAKRSKDHMMRHVVQSDLLRGLVDEDMFHGGTESRNNWEIFKRKLLPPPLNALYLNL